MVTPYFADDLVALHLADMRDAGSIVGDGSVDLIFTDPPYLKETLPCYEYLADFGARVLKPGGFLFAYSGTMFLPVVLDLLRKRLDYWWTFSLRTPGPTARVWNRKIGQSWKPVVVFTNGKPDNKTVPWLLSDELVSEGRSKKLHPWGQSTGPAARIIERWTKPGELVVDPFAGSGTTLEAARLLGRRAVGFEIDGERARDSAHRLSQVILPMPVVTEPEAVQLDLPGVTA